MKQETVFLTIGGFAIGASLVAIAMDSGYGFAYGSLLVFGGYALSLCGGDKTITLPTQSLDEARELMKDAKERWHLVAVTGHCVVAYRSEQKAFDALGRDGIGYAVVGGA